MDADRTLNTPSAGANRRHALLAVAVLVAGCGAPATLRKESVDLVSLEDAVCTGTASGRNHAEVELVVARHRIERIKVLSLDASPIGQRAKDSIPARILAMQAPVVDAVSGASEASSVLMNACIDALTKCAEQNR